MPKIRKIRVEDRKDSRGGGYSRRKFTVAEADAIREEYNTSTQKIMYQLIKGTTYTEESRGSRGGTRGYSRG